MHRWTLLALLFMSLFSLLIAPARALASQASTLNVIQRENQLPGTGDWQLSDPAPEDNQALRYPAIEGYAWTTSINAGDDVQFSVSTTSPSFSAAIYRMGWYQGKGARLMSRIDKIPGSPYTVPVMDASTGLIEAHWPLAFTLKTSDQWVSGMYLVKLMASNGPQSYIPFVLRSAQPADFAFIHAVNTDEAYNIWGGASLYSDYTHTLKAQRAFKVSFDRPFEQDTGAGQFLWWEYPMVRWLEQNGYAISYFSDVDLQNMSSSLQNYRAILIVGHSEYWSHQMRDTLETAVSKGVNLAVFGANTLYWQIRYEPQQSVSQARPERLIVCYKNPPLDPLYGKENSQVTGEFRYSPLNNPEQPFLGAMYGSWWPPAQGGLPWVVTDASNWVFTGTGLKNGDSLPGLVGYEFDNVDGDYPVAQGLTILATSPVIDNANKHTIANTTLYTTASGARVFDVGTIEWSWGLDSHSSIEGRWTPHANTLDAFVYNTTSVTNNDSLVNKAAQRITANILENFRHTVHTTQSTGFDFQAFILYAIGLFLLLYLLYCYWVWRRVASTAKRSVAHPEHLR